MRRLAAAGLALLCLAAVPTPPDALPDAQEEARARALFREIRCVVCQNESIDESQAEIAGDLRVLIRQRVAAGRSDADIRAALVDRYGEFILLRPTVSPGNAILWATPFAVVLLGGAALLAGARRRRPQPEDAAMEPWSRPEPDERNVT